MARKPWHQQRGQPARERSVDGHKQLTDRKVWETLTDPSERGRGRISAAERNWHLDNLLDVYFTVGAIQCSEYAAKYRLPVATARELIDATHATIRYVANSGDGAALKTRYLKKLEYYLGEAAEAGSWEAVTKMIELQAKISGSLAANKQEITHKHDLIGKLSPEMKQFFLKYNQLPREAFEVLGYPIPDSAPSLQLPPAQPAEIIEVYLEEVIPNPPTKDGYGDK